VADSPEHKKTGKPASVFSALVLVLLVSCAPTDVLIINDPYIETIQGKSWAPAGVLFSLRARLAGYRVTVATLEENEGLSGLLTRLERAVSIIVVSPPTSGDLRNPALAESRIVVAGGYPQYLPNTSVNSLVPDRRKIMPELGKLAAAVSGETGKPALALFDAGTDEKREEIDAFRTGAGSGDVVRIVNLADYAGRVLPDDFPEAFKNYGLLVLMAGPQNIPVLLATEDTATPVITEKLYGSDAWNDRIIISVEDDERKMTGSLLRIFESDGPEPVYYYPSRLKKGILYKNRGR
jgi:hypothetical protein